MLAAWNDRLRSRNEHNATQHDVALNNNNNDNNNNNNNNNNNRCHTTYSDIIHFCDTSFRLHL